MLSSVVRQRGSGEGKRNGSGGEQQHSSKNRVMMLARFIMVVQRQHQRQQVTPAARLIHLTRMGGQMTRQMEQRSVSSHVLTLMQMEQHTT